MGNAVLALVFRHQASERLQHWVHGRAVGHRAALAETADRDVDDLRLRGRDRVVAETKALDNARAETLHENVGAAQQPPQDRLAAVAFQIQRNCAFAEVDRQREGGLVGVAHAERAAPVTFAEWFNLDDVGAVLGEHHWRNRGRRRPG